MNNAGSSTHLPLALSKWDGVEATVKLATAAPLWVNLSSGSAVRLPTTVICVSPANSKLLHEVHAGLMGVLQGDELAAAVPVADHPDAGLAGKGVAVRTLHGQRLGRGHRGLLPAEHLRQRAD